MADKLKNDRFIRALLGKSVDKTPVWVMRQAGRYLPEYRKVRQQAGSFLDLCKNAELACEVTLQPLRRFDLDAAILFSDILTVPDALGLGLGFVAGEGPKFATPLDSSAAINKLAAIDVSAELGYVFNAVSTIRKALNNSLPLIGFAGSPWTVATYAVEGQSSKNFSKIKALMYQDPQAMHHLLQVLTTITIDYLNAQIESGAQAIMIFDTWGGVLSRACYREFSLQYMQQIVEGIHKNYQQATVPSIIFTKNGGQWLDLQAQIGADACGVDWTWDLSTAVKQVAGKVSLQGNLDPCALYAKPEVIKSHVKQVLAAAKNARGHVFNLGHGIHPQVNPDNLKVMVDAVHQFSAN